MVYYHYDSFKPIWVKSILHKLVSNWWQNQELRCHYPHSLSMIDLSWQTWMKSNEVCTINRVNRIKWRCSAALLENAFHSYPKWEYKKNVSEVWYIYLKSKLYDNSKNYFSKIVGLGPCPLTNISFERSILEKNVWK